MEKHVHYSVEELAQESSFINWVHRTDTQDVLYWDKLLSSHPELSERMKKARSIVRSMSYEEKEPSVALKNKLWSNIESSISDGKVVKMPTKPKKGLRYLVPALVAASLVLVLAVWGALTGSDTVEYVTKYAHLDKKSLPDGSFVTLNANSRVTFDKKAWENERLLHLEGEAFFNVMKGESFTVNTANGDVQVLGTSFNVFSRGNELKVSCETGMVSVVTESNKTVLVKGESMEVVNGQHRMDINLMHRGNWRNGEYIYRNTPMSDVVSDLERNYNIRVELLEELKPRTFSGVFAVENVDKALSEVFWPMGYDYSINDGVINLSKK